MFEYEVLENALFITVEAEDFHFSDLKDFLESNGFKLVFDSDNYSYIVDDNQNVYLYSDKYSDIYETLKRKGYAFAPKVLVIPIERLI